MKDMNTLKINRVPKSIWTNPIHFIACGFGVGAMPLMPGTFGTLVGVLFYLGLVHFSLKTYVFVTLILFIIGVIICDKTNRDFGTHDHPAAVWDEIVGFLLTMIAVPYAIKWTILGFVFFRLFDIWKPWPIKWIEKNLPLGLAVMADDAAAAFYAAVLLHLLIRMH